MAVKGQLDIPMEEVKCYDNFSVLYLSSIINSYRRWAVSEYRHIEKHIPPSEADLKYLEMPKEEIHWGSMIEKAYQHFLSFQDESWRLFPVGFYEQLVVDKIFDEEFFRKAMPVVRKGVIGQLQREIVKHQMRSFDGFEKDERLASEKSRIETKVNSMTAEIKSYESGEKDSVLELTAKQYCVLQYFKNSKQNMKQHVYVRVE